MFVFFICNMKFEKGMHFQQIKKEFQYINV